MTLVKVSMHNRQISSIEILGHADYDEYGKDIVCAGISALSFGTLNALDELFGKEVELEAGQSKIVIRIKQSNEKLQTCLEFFLIQAGTLQESYPENIKIQRKEV